MTGDLNMNECPLDRSTLSYSQLMSLKEKLTWLAIKSKFNIEDYFSRHNGPIYLWDNLQDDGIQVLARLHRFYIFSNVDQNHYSHIVHYKISGDSSFSKCHPISLLINLSNSPLGGSSHNVNASILQDAKDPFKVLREAAPSQMSFFTKLRKIIKYHKQFCIA